MTEKEKELFRRAFSTVLMFLAGASIALFLTARVAFAVSESTAVIIAVLAYALHGAAPFFVACSERTAGRVIGLVLAAASGVGVAPLLSVLAEGLVPVPELLVVLSLPLAVVYAVEALLFAFRDRVSFFALREHVRKALRLGR